MDPITLLLAQQPHAATLHPLEYASQAPGL